MPDYIQFHLDILNIHQSCFHYLEIISFAVKCYRKFLEGDFRRLYPLQFENRSILISYCTFEQSSSRFFNRYAFYSGFACIRTICFAGQFGGLFRGRMNFSPTSSSYRGPYTPQNMPGGVSVRQLYSGGYRTTGTSSATPQRTAARVVQRTVQGAPARTVKVSKSSTSSVSKEIEKPVLRQVHVSSPTRVQITPRTTSDQSSSPRTIQIYQLPSNTRTRRTQSNDFLSDPWEREFNSFDREMARTVRQMDSGFNSFLGGGIGNRWGGLFGMGGMGDAWDARSDFMGDRWDMASDRIDGRFDARSDLVDSRFDYMSDRADSYGDYASDVYDTMADRYDYS